MNIKLLKDLLAVPTVSNDELPMVIWLLDYIKHNIPGAKVSMDEWWNLYVTKGNSEFSPCVAAHSDTVHAHQKITIAEDGGCLVGHNSYGHRTGIGGDDKAGIFVCLSLLRRFNNIRAVFFATEEYGCVGARNVNPAFMVGVAYLVEFDCPSRHMLSYSCGGVRLFANNGEFIKTALPALQKHGSVLWQKHPYTDVMAIRQKFPVSCLNLSCGYYNWHSPDEFVKISDVGLAIEQGEAVLAALGNTHYACPIIIPENEGEPLIKITGLHVPPP